MGKAKIVGMELSTENYLIKCLPHYMTLDWSKLKAFVDDILNLTEKLKFVLGRLENIMGKGENAVYQHFLLFPP